MILGNPADLKDILAPGRRLFGLDVGSKTVGLALSDPGLIIATPYRTLQRTRFRQDAESLRQAVAGEKVGGLLIGLPINMDGSEGPRAQSVRQFAANLSGVMPDLPIAFWDERLSTLAVTRTLLEADTSRRRRAEVVDKLAAAYILQGYLDSLPRGGGAPPAGRAKGP